jgi:hypothetical protein
LAPSSLGTAIGAQRGFSFPMVAICPILITAKNDL